MNVFSSSLAAFLTAELIFILIALGAYRLVSSTGVFQFNKQERRLLLIPFLALPLLTAYYLLPGLLSRAQFSSILPDTGGETTGNQQEYYPILTPPAGESVFGEGPSGQAGTGGGPAGSPAGTAQPALETPAAGEGTPDEELATNGTPAPTEPEGWIIFVCQIFQDTDRDQICLIHPDGLGSRRLTSADSADHNFPALTPGGESFLYAGNATGNFEIYEQELGGEAQQLTHSTSDSFAPSLSPDGAQILFTRRVEGANTIWLMNRDGSEARQIFGLPRGYGWDPNWSPDGETVFFTSNFNGSSQLYRMNLDGTGLLQVTNLPELLGGSPSPSGSSMALYAGPAWNRELYSLALDGSSPVQITSGGNNLSPSFSPDGGWIVFTSYRDHYGDKNGCELYIMRADGSDVRRLTENETCDWQPRWGP